MGGNGGVTEMSSFIPRIASLPRLRFKKKLLHVVQRALRWLAVPELYFYGKWGKHSTRSSGPWKLRRKILSLITTRERERNQPAAANGFGIPSEPST